MITPSTVAVVSTAAASRPARARLGVWPHEDDVVHLVLLDHQMVPSSDDIAAWIDDAHRRGARAVRTGALFPVSTAAFLAAGFQPVDSLTLLEQRLDTANTAAVRGSTSTAAASRMRRLRPSMLHESAAIDGRSFARTWSNDAAALADIMSATPHHRSRSIHQDGRMVAFSISGRADRTGYIQRLAVDPSARRRGLARVLVIDALRWMQRRDVERAMVNTASDNAAALALYRSLGFEAREEPLLILERELATA